MKFLPVLAATAATAAAGRKHPYGEHVRALRERDSLDIQDARDLHAMAAKLETKAERYSLVADLGFASDFIQSDKHRSLFETAVRVSRHMTDETCRDSYEHLFDDVAGTMSSDLENGYWATDGTEGCHAVQTYYAGSMNGEYDSENFGTCDDDSTYAAYACEVDTLPLSCAIEADDECNDSNWAYFTFGGGDSKKGVPSISTDDCNPDGYCPSSYIHDGFCDDACNIASCNYDDGDCVVAVEPNNDQGSPVYVTLDDGHVGYDWANEAQASIAVTEAACTDYVARCGLDNSTNGLTCDEVNAADDDGWWWSSWSWEDSDDEAFDISAIESCNNIVHCSTCYDPDLDTVVNSGATAALSLAAAGVTLAATSLLAY